jgi:hypothetical protein
MEPVLVSVGNNFKIWDTDGYSQLYAYTPENGSGINCTSWSADTSGVASYIKDDDKILLTFYKNHKYSSHEIKTQGLEKLSYLQFPRTSQNHVYLASKNELHCYDLSRHKSRKSFSLKSDISCFISNKSDSYVAIGCKNGSIQLLTTISNQLSQPFTADKCAGQLITCLRYSAVRAGFLGASCESGVLSFWDCNASKNIFNICDHLAPCTSFAFSPLNDSLAVSCGLDKKLICHDTKSRKSVFNLQLEFPCTCVDFDTDGTTVAVGTSRGKILVYDLRNTARPSKTFQAHTGRVTSLAYKPKIDRMNVSQVMSAVKSTSKSKLRSAISASALKTVKEEGEKENSKPERTLTGPGAVIAQQAADVHFTPGKDSDVISPLDNDNNIYNRRDSISSQLFSPLREADISFNTPNLSSRGSSRRTSDTRLSTEGLFSPVLDGEYSKRTSLATPLSSPYLTSIQEEAGASDKISFPAKNIGARVDKSEIPKLSLETLTEVAASVTKRREGSPEYDEVAKTPRDINIPVRPPTTVEVSSDESCSSYPPRHGALVKPLSATKAKLRDPDIVRVRDLPQDGGSSMPVKNPPNLEPVSLSFNNMQADDSGKGSIGAELEKFYSENRSLGHELQSVTTAFPGAVLDTELSPT